MSTLKNVWEEIKKQINDTPIFAPATPSHPIMNESLLNNNNKQIEKGIKNHKNRLVFLIGPYGGGKTTQINHFIKKNPHHRYCWKSFVKINSLEMAFLHLTQFTSRALFVFFCLGIAVFIMWLAPKTVALSFLFILSFLFGKNHGNLVYLFQEGLDNLSHKKSKIIIIEDLERSSLSMADQFALLANLWQLKRSYLIPLGYSPDEPGTKLKIFEYATKLEGVIIEINNNKSINLKLIKKLDPHFPFEIDSSKKGKTGDWISLFTPREMILLYEQVELRNTLFPHSSLLEIPRRKHILYICVSLEILSDKLGLGRKDYIFDEGNWAILDMENKKLSREQQYYLSTFIDSIVPHPKNTFENDKPPENVDLLTASQYND